MFKSVFHKDDFEQVHISNKHHNSCLAQKHNDTQAQINSMIKRKLLEMDKVKAVWNKYAANKITVTIIKS